MLVLALDTSGAYVSIALADESGQVAAYEEKMERGQGEALMPMIDKMMRDSHREMTDLQGIAVAVGPGSFTGVRVALAAARGFGLALQIPVMGVTNFEAAAVDLAETFWVILDSKRGDYFAQSFDAWGHPTSTPMVCDINQVAARHPSYLVGDAAEEVSALLGIPVLVQPLPHAVAVARVALSRKDAPLPAEPLYLREADVTVASK